MFVKDEIVKWVREWFDANGPGCNAVIGLSGGKDSSIAAALCVAAIGKDRVVGVLMPNGDEGADDADAVELADFLRIRRYIINIQKANDDILEQMSLNGINPLRQTTFNLPARLRMASLYAVSQSLNGRVVNTCNLSENWVGYSTRYGDDAGDFSPFSDLTVGEVKQIGGALGLPRKFTDKVPADGLSGKTDEDSFGFSYETLDKYIRTGVCGDAAAKSKIDTLHQKNRFKLEPMSKFKMTEENK